MKLARVAHTAHSRRDCQCLLGGHVDWVAEAEKHGEPWCVLDADQEGLHLHQFPVKILTIVPNPATQLVVEPGPNVELKTVSGTTYKCSEVPAPDLVFLVT